MRVLLCCEFYPPSVGGVQEVMRQLAERLVLAGHQATVASTYVAERMNRRASNGVGIEEFHASGNLVNGLQGGTEIERYRAYVLRQDYDVLVIKAAQQWTFDAIAPVLSKIKRPKVFIPCGFSGWFDPRYADYYARMPEWLAEFDRLIFYASDYRDVNLARQCCPEKICIVPNGADEREFNVARDPAFRERLGIPEDAFVVLTVGSLTGLKGHLELAKAFKSCDFGQRPATLLLIGNKPDGSAKQLRGLQLLAAVYRKGGVTLALKWLLRTALVALRLHCLLRTVTLDEVIAQINRMPRRQALLIDASRRDVVQAYLNSNLFVFASQIEYSPLVLYEAAAAGLPFLSVPVGNAREIAEWTKGGEICEAVQDDHGYTKVDPVVLGKRMHEMASRPDLLASLAAAGRSMWAERFTWEKIFPLYERILEQCVREKGFTCS